MIFFKVVFLLVVFYLKEANFQLADPNIVGGTIAKLGSWPSIAFVNWKYKAAYSLPTGVTVTVSSSVNCDGVLISRTKVLTAAHCIPTSVRFTYAGVTYIGQVYNNQFYPTQGSSFSIYLGLQDKTSIVNSGTYSAPTVKASVLRVTVHPNWNSATLANDIAVFTLTSPVTLSTYIQIVSLPAASFTYPAPIVSAWAAGWGYTSNNAATTPNQLYQVQLTVYPAKNCPYSGFNTLYQICAGNVYGGQGVCQGDSGGPLYYNNVLVGITSFTNAAGCGLSGPQNGFTRVSAYISWINSAVSNEVTSPPTQTVTGAIPQIRLPSPTNGTVVA